MKFMTEPQRQLLVLKQNDESAFLQEVKRIEELLEFCYSLQDKEKEKGLDSINLK